MTNQGGAWPTAEGTLLLRAALLPGEPGRRALEAWRAAVSLDDLDAGSRRLLPLLYTRLAAEHPDDPLLPSLERAFHKTAAVNAALAEVLAGAIGVLDRAGVPTMVLKGTALIVRGLVPSGARPMNDGDLLVPTAQTLAARDALVREGWRLLEPLDAARAAVRHAVMLEGPAGHRLDLHWHVLAECLQPDADAVFWQAAEAVSLNGAASRTLSPADMLLHIIVHGLRWSRVPPLRWAADAAIVVRAEGRAIDWDRLAGEAEARTLALPVARGLTYLRDVLDVPVPDSTHARLSRVPASRMARAEYRVKMRPRSLWTLSGLHWFRHRRLSGSGSFVVDALRLPSYLHRRFGRR